MIEKSFSIKNERAMTIRGVMLAPEKEGSFPTVIISHGYSSRFSELIHHGAGYVNRDIVCVFFDFCGGGPETTSDGAMTEMTVLTEAEDLRCVIDYVSTFAFVNKEELFLLGESMGGFVSCLVAADYKAKLKGMILWYPAFCIPDDSTKRFAQGDNTCMGYELSSEFNRTSKDIDIYERLTAFGGPVIIIHGDNDGIVNIVYSKRAVEIYDKADLITIPGAGHGFDGEDSCCAREHSIDFILGVIS